MNVTIGDPKTTYNMTLDAGPVALASAGLLITYEITMHICIYIFGADKGKAIPILISRIESTTTPNIQSLGCHLMVKLLAGPIIWTNKVVVLIHLFCKSIH